MPMSALCAALARGTPSRRCVHRRREGVFYARPLSQRLGFRGDTRAKNNQARLKRPLVTRRKGRDKGGSRRGKLAHKFVSAKQKKSKLAQRVDVARQPAYSRRSATPRQGKQSSFIHLFIFSTSDDTRRFTTPTHQPARSLASHTSSRHPQPLCAPRLLPWPPSHQALGAPTTLDPRP